uniref:TorF family putative porin n=1 Tax=Cellvibrio fontiphilus TaxID=1815559 RepID=UPI002B4BC0C3|nr:TorF family putative porin [Cellvibrio fontiphilus]
MQITKGFAAFSMLLAVTTQPVHAAVSGKISLMSNYLSYGLSQTLDEPAVQLTTTWSGESGLYLSGWASQVDFGEGTDTEMGVYAGYSMSINEGYSLDAGIAQFLYEGADISDEYKYNEIYTLFNTPVINIGLHYAWDYFGSGAGYTVVQVSRVFSINNFFNLTLGADYAVTSDETRYSILGESDYLHYFARAEKEMIGLQWSLSLHETSMPESETDEARIVAGVGWAF